MNWTGKTCICIIRELYVKVNFFFTFRLTAILNASDYSDEADSGEDVDTYSEGSEVLNIDDDENAPIDEWVTCTKHAYMHISLCKPTLICYHFYHGWQPFSPFLYIWFKIVGTVWFRSIISDHGIDYYALKNENQTKSKIQNQR